MPRINANLLLGLLTVAVSLLILFVWIPLDVETGVLEKVRRRMQIGDAMAPSVAAALLGLSGLLLLLESRRQAGAGLSAANLRFLLLAGLPIGGGLLLMRWLGPAVVGTIGAVAADIGEYRQLRVSFPWSWLGFVAGGGLLAGGMTCLIEGRLGWRAFSIGIIAALALAAFYTLPFDNLLLPPNGDV